MKDFFNTFKELPDVRGIIVGVGFIFITAFIISAVYQQIIITKKSKYTRGVIHRNDVLKIKRNAKILFFTSLAIISLVAHKQYIQVGTLIANKADDIQEVIISKLLKDDRINNDHVN